MQKPPLSIFVTGATGFIGRSLVSALHEHGFQTRALVRPGTSHDTRLPDDCTQHSADLTDVEKLAAAVAGNAAVIYCAGAVRGREPADFFTANVEGVRAMARALKRLSVPPHFLLVSSLAASRPELSDYANSKYQGEQILRACESLPWSILRPPAVYGEGDREMLPVLQMARRGLLLHAGPANQRLSLIHVSDLVSAIVAWLRATPVCRHKTYAIDDGAPGGYDWAAIAKAVRAGKSLTFRIPRPLLDLVAGVNVRTSSWLGYAPMLTPGKVRELVQTEWLCDNTHFSADTGWAPKINLEQGARQLFRSLA